MSTTAETDTRPEPVSHRADQHQDTTGRTGSTAKNPVAAAAAAPLGWCSPWCWARSAW